MSHHFKRIVAALAVAGAVSSASAFSLLGPYSDWQVTRIGYNLPGDIGGPMYIGEEYRWNIKTITYGFDESFLNYFGSQGQQAVQQAVAILNALPPVSQMSSNLSEFPLNSKESNDSAAGLGLLDVKSTALAFMMEELGPASPERYTWALRSRVELTIGTNTFTNYFVIKLNSDPVTLNQSSYVNGQMYGYVIREYNNPTYADAEEVPTSGPESDPNALPFSTVINAADGLQGGLFVGQFFTGLTRDDAGCLRYLYKPNNYNVEQLLPGTTGAGFAVSGGSPWVPWPGTGTGTNINGLVADTALRPGVDKVSFQQGQYDSLLGSFITITNVSTDTFISNSAAVNQTIQRVLTQPDLLFAADDLGVNPNGNPLYMARTDTSGWADNDAINGQTPLAGPGVIQPQVVITFSKVGVYYFNQFPGDLTEAGGQRSFVWGSYDASTNIIIYPNGTSINDLEQMVLGQ